MNLTEFLNQRGQGVALARSIGVPQELVSQWRTGARPVPIERCVDIERATGGAVTRRDLRPDDWHRIWPELVERDPLLSVLPPTPADQAAA